MVGGPPTVIGTQVLMDGIHVFTWGPLRSDTGLTRNVQTGLVPSSVKGVSYFCIFVCMNFETPKLSSAGWGATWFQACPDVCVIK